MTDNTFDFDKGIKKLKSAERAYQTVLNACCLHALEQIAEHGNWDYINRVRDAVRLNATKNAVAKWIVAMSPSAMKTGKIRKDQDRAEGFEYDMDKAKTEDVMSFKQAAVIESFTAEDLKGAVLRLVKQFDLEGKRLEGADEAVKIIAAQLSTDLTEMAENIATAEAA